MRPYYLDRVDIGEFLIVEDNVKIVDFTEKINLFNVYCDEGEDAFKKKVKRRVLFDAISNDLSKPLRSFDSELEYIPTQYICEYFKDMGADGIMFESSVRSKGKNLVLFYPEKATCVNVYPFEVSKITIMCTEAKARAFCPEDSELEDDTNAAVKYVGVSRTL